MRARLLPICGLDAGWPRWSFTPAPSAGALACSLQSSSVTRRWMCVCESGGLRRASACPQACRENEQRQRAEGQDGKSSSPEPQGFLGPFGQPATNDDPVRTRYPSQVHNRGHVPRAQPRAANGDMAQAGDIALRRRQRSRAPGYCRGHPESSGGPPTQALGRGCRGYVHPVQRHTTKDRSSSVHGSSRCTGPWGSRSPRRAVFVESGCA